MKVLYSIVLLLLLLVFSAKDMYGYAITLHTITQEAQVDNGVTPDISGPFLQDIGYSEAHIEGDVNKLDGTTAFLSATSLYHVHNVKITDAGITTTNTSFNFAGWSNGFEMNHTFNGTYEMCVSSDYGNSGPVLVTSLLSSTPGGIYSYSIRDASGDVIAYFDDYSTSRLGSFDLIQGELYYFTTVQSELLSPKGDSFSFGCKPTKVLLS